MDIIKYILDIYLLWLSDIYCTGIWAHSFSVESGRERHALRDSKVVWQFQGSMRCYGNIERGKKCDLFWESGILRYREVGIGRVICVLGGRQGQGRVFQAREWGYTNPGEPCVLLDLEHPLWTKFCKTGREDRRPPGYTGRRGRWTVLRYLLSAHSHDAI